MTPTDSTMVTGSPTGARLPRTGDVLGERWEIRATISSDALYGTYRGTDQETDQSVLVRVVGLGRLSERDAQRMAARLRLLVGMGGPVLSPIKDVDHEGARLFIIEKFPEGASFRSVLETRRAKGQLFTPAELVPLVAHLHSALGAITAPWFHGDVRAERIYVGHDRVLLTGGFALSVTPGDIARETLASDTGLRRELAPEAAEGVSGAAADRFGVALLVWEALTGTRPEIPETAATGSGSPKPPASLGELGVLLARYLSVDPASRPASLEPLVVALAQRAKVPVPRIPIESFSVDEPPTDIDQTELAMGPDPSISSETMDLLTTSSGDTPSPSSSDTARHASVGLDGKKKDGGRDLSDIDPALLAAAQASRGVSDSGTFDLGAAELSALETDGGPKKAGVATSSSDLDPRLVRAALGVSLEDSGDELTNDTLPASAAAASKQLRQKPIVKTGSIPAPKRAMPIKPKPAGTTQEIEASDLELITAGQKATKDVRAPAAKIAAPKPSAGPPRPSTLDSAETFVGGKRLDLSEPIALQPMPMQAIALQPMPMQPVAPQPMPAPQPMQSAPAPMAPAPSSVAPAPSPNRVLAETPVVPQPLERKAASVPPASPSRSPIHDAPTRVASPISGNLIIAIAVLCAVAILGAAFWYRHVQENTAREHRIDERLRELRGGP